MPVKQKLKTLPPVMLLVRDVNKLEHDAAAQYKFNRFWAILWGCSMAALPFFPRLYGGDMAALIIQEISLWANFATHFGAMSSALAAMSTVKTVEHVTDTVTDISEDISDIHAVTDAIQVAPYGAEA